MRKIRFLLMLIGLFAAASRLQAQPEGKSEIKVTHFTLDNGLEVYLTEDHNSPEVYGAVAVKAGSKYDPADATGMAHYLEHMCFKGTEDLGTTDYASEKPYLDEIENLYKQLKQTTEEKEREVIQKKINEASVKAAQYAIPNEMDRLIKSIGGKDLNAFTSFERVVYYNSFPSHEIDKWLDIYSHRFINPVFRLFQPELEVVYEEKNRGEDNMGTKLFEEFLKNFFKKHPYGQQTTIGRTEDLKNPDLSRMREYYNTYFVANNMALCISGDINTEQIIPIIKEKFGQWKSGKVPQFPKFEEAPFNGRELIERRLTPIKLGIMGYRTVPQNDPDEITLEVISNILSNESETGVLDDLRNQGKIQMAQVAPLSLNDMGGLAIVFLPKIVGQSLDDAESVVREALEKIKKGDFDPDLLVSAKSSLRVNFYQGMENNQSKVYNMSDCFIRGISWSEFSSYPDKVEAVSMQDIERVANKYLGDNYLSMHSKMGLPPKDKIKKPGFEPVKPKDSVKSAYAKHFESLPSGTPVPKFIDFRNDFSKDVINDGSVLWYANNPVNDIFSIKLVYHVGYWQIPGLTEAATYVGYLGADTMSSRAFKKEMSKLGCSYRLWVDGDKLNIYLSGLEENSTQAIALLNKLITTPRPDKKKYDLMVSDIVTNRKLENGDPASVADIMDDYIHYGSKSGYLDRLSIEELKQKDSAALLKTFREALNYRLSIHYTGKKPLSEVDKEIRNLAFNYISKPDTARGALMRYKEPTIYVLYRKDARQTHIYFYAKSDPYDSAAWPYANAFNSYFGGDMSSLAFQEIREFRSLAYSVYTYMHSNRNDDMSFDGYLGCQGDKTLDALSAMNDLLKNMPEKPDRLDAIRTGLINSAYNSRPSFRSLTEQAERLEGYGYNDDPSKRYLGVYKGLEYKDIDSYYQEHIRQLPVSMGIVGTKKNVPVKELEKYGKVVVVTEDQVLKK